MSISLRRSPRRWLVLASLMLSGLVSAAEPVVRIGTGDWVPYVDQHRADGGALAKAIDYSLRRWPALARYATNGFYPIDNNPVENAIRPIAIGKKNWLFAGSEAAGQRAAAIQSLLETARLNGIEPMAWLTDTLDKLPSWPNSRIDELLPLKKPV